MYIRLGRLRFLERYKYLDSPIFNQIGNLVIELYKINGAGGLLHMVLDDGNFEDCHILWSQKHIEEVQDENVTEKEKEICRQICRLMLKLRKSQRYHIWQKVYEIEENNK